MMPRVLFSILVFVGPAAVGDETPFVTSLPESYLIDYAATHVDNPAYLEKVAAAPPDILHVGHDVPVKSHLGPCRGTGAFPDVYALMPLEECRADIARITQYVASLHGAGVRTVIPYISDVIVFGDHETRTGFWEFYDHWDDYAPLGFGARPAADPITWMQSGERRPAGKNDMYVYAPCVNHPDWQRYLCAVVRIVAQCGYDGTFVDINSFRCPNACCRAPFARYLSERYSRAQLKELFGFDDSDSVRLADEGASSLLGVETCRFRASSMARLFTTLREAGESVRPGFMILPNLSPMAHLEGVRIRVGNGQDTGRWAQACSWLMFEEMQQSGRFGVDTISDCVLQYKLAFACGIRGGMLLYHARDAAGISLAMAEAGAGGGGGLIQGGYECPDTRAQFEAFWRTHRDLFEGRRPWAQAGVCYLRDELYWRNFGHLGAVYRIRRELSDEHVLFDFITEQNFSPETLRGMKVVILPETRYLSGVQVAALREYVEQGGVLVTIGACGARDELGAVRASPPFDTGTPQKGRVVALPSLDACVPAKPFELFDLTEDQANDIDVVMRHAAAAPASSAASRPLAALLESTVGTDLAVAAPETPRTVRVSAFVKEDAEDAEDASLAVHLVNYDVPIRGIGQSGPPVVVEGLRLNLPLPEGWRAGAVNAFEPGAPEETLAYTQTGDRVELTVPRLTSYKVLRIVRERGEKAGT